MIYLLLVLAVVYVALRCLSARRTMRVPVAFAGSPDGSVVTKQLAMPKNKPIFMEGDTAVDVSKLRCYAVEGASLAPMGLMDGSLLYVEEEPVLKDNTDLIGHFIILRIDDDRTRKEHPEKPLTVEKGFKVRKVVALFSGKMGEEALEEKVRELIERDSELAYKLKDEEHSPLKRILNKYKFAVSYYGENQELIVSITYKRGSDKDYSFHSTQFLQGIVRYKSLPTSSI